MNTLGVEYYYKNDKSREFFKIPFGRSNEFLTDGVDSHRVCRVTDFLLQLFITRQNLAQGLVTQVDEAQRQHGALVQLLQAQAGAYGWKGRIVTNPNCATVVLAMALAPLRQFGLKTAIQGVGAWLVTPEYVKTIGKETLNGIQTVVADGAGCCGAIREHLGDHEASLDDMRRNIDAWWPLVSGHGERVEALVMNASGCGVMVKDYAHLLAHDPAYADKARRVGLRAGDVLDAAGIGLQHAGLHLADVLALAQQVHFDIEAAGGDRSDEVGLQGTQGPVATADIAHGLHHECGQHATEGRAALGPVGRDVEAHAWLAADREALAPGQQVAQADGWLRRRGGCGVDVVGGLAHGRHVVWRFGIIERSCFFCWAGGICPFQCRVSMWVIWGAGTGRL